MNDGPVRQVWPANVIDRRNWHRRIRIRLGRTCKIKLTDTQVSAWHEVRTDDEQVRSMAVWQGTCSRYENGFRGRYAVRYVVILMAGVPGMLNDDTRCNDV